MNKVIKVKLSPKSIGNAIDELNAYKREVEQKAKLLVATLAERGAEIARAKIVEMGAVDTANLLGSVESVLIGNVGYIRVNADYGVFVEFGTGIVGEGSPHALAGEFDWQYDVNEHGEAGWHFPADDGSWPITKGQPSRPFMYETAQQLRAELPYFIKGVFG